MASSTRRMSSDFRFSLAQTTTLGSLFLLMLTILTGVATDAASEQSAQHLIVSGSLPVGKVGVAYKGTATASICVANDCTSNATAASPVMVFSSCPIHNDA